MTTAGRKLDDNNYLAAHWRTCGGITQANTTCASQQYDYYFVARRCTADIIRILALPLRYYYAHLCRQSFIPIIEWRAYSPPPTNRPRRMPCVECLKCDKMSRAVFCASLICTNVSAHLCVVAYAQSPGGVTRMR